MTETVTERSGGCLCGAVRFAAAGEPLWVAHCHCTSCRRTTASPMTTYAGYPRERVTFTGSLQAFASSPGVRRSFCSRCGTPLAYEGERWPDETHLFVCTFDEPAALTPKAHVHVAEQLPWLHLADDLPRLQTTSSASSSST